MRLWFRASSGRIFNLLHFDSFYMEKNIVYGQLRGEKQEIRSFLSEDEAVLYMDAIYSMLHEREMKTTLW